MALCCVICGCWMPAVGRDCLEMCDACFTQNFAGSQEMQPDAPSARQAPFASVFPAPRQLTLSPRQVHAMRRMQERWRAREDD